MLRKKALKEGNTLPIYLDWQSKKDYRGNAKLLKRLVKRESGYHEREYEFEEQYNPSTKQATQIIYSYEWWLVEFIDGKEKGFVTAVKISYYKRKTIDLKN